MKTIGNIIWVIFWRPRDCGRVLYCRYIYDAYHYWHTLWLAKHEDGAARTLAIRFKNPRNEFANGMSESIHEHIVVLRRRHLDMSDPHCFGHRLLHYPGWHTIRHDALPPGKTCTVTIWKRNRVRRAPLLKNE